MRTEVKIGLLAIPLFGLIVAVCYFWNLPKNEKSNLPVSNTPLAGKSEPAGKLPSASGAKPPAPVVTAMKPPVAPPSTPTGATPSGSSAKPDSMLASSRNDPQLPPVATPPPTRKTIESPIDASSPTTGVASPGAGASPPPPGTSTLTPTRATPDPAPATTGNPAPSDSATGSTAKPTPSADPPKPAEEPLKARTNKPSTLDSELERVGDPPLAGRASVGSPSTAGRDGTRALPTPKTAEALSGDAPSGSDATRPYTIQKGDSLVALARQHYGDEKFWRLIKNANPGLNENRIIVGTVIKLPAKETAAAPATNPPPAKQPATRKNGATPGPDAKTPAVKADSNLASATDKPRGADPSAASKSAVADSKAKPAPDDKSDADKPKAAVHKVARGETLRKIAKQRLNDENRWREIFNLNRAQLATPDGLEIGMTLNMPGADKPGKTPKSDKRVASKPSKR